MQQYKCIYFYVPVGSELEAEQTSNAIQTEASQATTNEQEEEEDQDKEGDLNTDVLSKPQEPVDADIPDNITTPEGGANDEDMNIEEAHGVADDISQPNLKEVAPESMDPPKTDKGDSILHQYGRTNLSGDATGGFSDLKSKPTSQLQQTEGASIINTIDTEATDSCTSVQADVDTCTSQTTCLPKTDSTVTIDTDQSLKSESLLSTESAAGLQLGSATTATKIEEPSTSEDITESTTPANEVSPPTLEVGSQYKVFIVSLDSPYDFVCHLSGYDPVIEAVSSLLSDIYQFAPEDEYTISKEELIVGQLVCAQFSEDNSYYRARVLHKIDNEYEVEYLDYGNREVVPLTRLFKLHPQLLTSCYPPFALHCSLSDLPAEMEDEEEIGRLVDAMKELISEDKPTLMEVVSRPPPGKDDKTYEVKLFSSNELVCGEEMETINASISQLLETGGYNSVPSHQKGTKEMALNETLHMNGSSHLSDVDMNIQIDSKSKGHTTACVEGSNST